MLATTPRARSPHQDVQTPPDLIEAIEAKFGPISFDLAAADQAASRGREGFISPEQDSLSVDWCECGDGLLWLNPPFSKIGPWAAKCAAWRVRASAGVLLFLVPGSIDSNWWNDSVRNHCRSIALAPRITFVGHDQPFPKPMTLNVYQPDRPGDDRVRYWRWK